MELETRAKNLHWLRNGAGQLNFINFNQYDNLLKKYAKRE